MKMEVNKAYGAAIERGEIAGKEETGYIVESYCLAARPKIANTPAYTRKTPARGVSQGIISLI